MRNASPFVVFGVVLGVLLMTTQPASAHAVSRAGRTYVSGINCTGASATVDHGNGNGQFRAVSSSLELQYSPYNPCGVFKWQPPGDIAVAYHVFVWDPPEYGGIGWMFCGSTNFVYNTSGGYSSRLTSTMPSPPCGARTWYSMDTWAFVWDPDPANYFGPTWLGGKLALGDSHFLPA